MKQFVNALHQHFEDNKPYFESLGLPAIAHIDKYRGQPLNPEAFEAFELPALFYQTQIQWIKKGKTYQGALTINFHILQDATWEISSIATNKEQGLAQVSLIQELHYVLDGFESPNTGKLDRVSDIPVDSGVTIYDMLSYTCSYTEPKVVTNTTMKETTGEEVGLTGELVNAIRT